MATLLGKSWPSTLYAPFNIFVMLFAVFISRLVYRFYLKFNCINVCALYSYLTYQGSCVSAV